MKADPETIGQRRIAREDCEVGDWVDAATIPEWSAELQPHVFRRPKISISPVEGDMGGMLPDQFEESFFVAERRGDRLSWVRQS
jgi:hypothetical protein